ncbi:MAG: prephenate dehydrogenase/arogenate dehydrogenase family protein [Gammaproteobacteria bacterium]|nr:prephenate dehydrogenase/arogenate dehydrogenase family protein [Gammaproteobacteria bacterium]
MRRSLAAADTVRIDPPFRRILIIGVGLIGGSLARAIRRAGHRIEIVGYGRNHLNLQRAVELGVIDRFVTALPVAVAEADLIVVAAPVGSTATILRAIRPHLAPDAVITDVGSTKGSVAIAARETLGGALSAFVPGHPIAGNERGGVEASSASLFDRRMVVLTPLTETEQGALARVRALWESVGARVVEMDVEYHDRLLAATSHLPHVLAYALVEALTRMDGGEEIFRYAAGGFRDFTRIASSDPVMWRDICLANAGHLRESISAFRACLDELDGMIRDGEGDKLVELFSRAKAVRDRNVK